MYKLLLSSLLISVGLSSLAQVPLNAVLEHFTNTKCSICASRNPGLYTNKDAHPSVNYLSIHPSSPYAGCILSIQNKADNDAHTNFLGVYGSTPKIVINGDLVSGSSDYSSAAIYSPYTSLTTPFSIDMLQTNYGTDSIKATLIIKKHAAFTNNGKLFLGAVEDTVFVDGGNGEKQHYHVLRKSMTGTSPINVALDFAIGDSVIISKTVSVNSVWKMNRMFTMAILYDSSNNKVLQSQKTAVQATTTNIINKKTSLTFNIFPNPANNSILISTEKNDSYIGNIFSVVGNKIGNFSFINKVRLNTSEFSNGIYILQLTKGSETIYQKIEIQH